MNKLQRFGLLVPALFLAACQGQETGFTEPNLGPLAYVRFVHAVPDQGLIVGRWVDKVENWVGTPSSGSAVLGIGYRTVTPFQGVSAGSRNFKLFPASTNIDTAQMVLADVTSDLAANTYYTFLYTGYRACNGGAPAASVVRIAETHPAIPAGNFALRVVQAAPGFAAAQDYHVTATATSTLGAATFANIGYSQDAAALSARTWVARATGAAVLRGFNTGTTATANITSTVTAGAAATTSSTNALPGSTQAGSALTAFVFPQQLTAACANTGTVQSAYGVDVRPPVPQ